MKRRYARKLALLSEGLKALGNELRTADGIAALNPGESRPPGYYLVNHYTGKPIAKPGTVIPRSKVG
jgi:hypothetical protein